MRGFTAGAWVTAALALAPVACSSSNNTGGASGDDVSAFLGEWTSNGTQTEDCPSGMHTDTGMLSVAIVEGSGAGAISTQATTSSGVVCPLNWTVAGDTATLAGMQACPTVPGSVGGTWTPTFTAGTLTLSGGAVAVQDMGTAVFVDGTTETCSFTQTGTYTK